MHRLLILTALLLLSACAMQVVPAPAAVPLPTTVTAVPTVGATPFWLEQIMTPAAPMPATVGSHGAPLVSDDEITKGFDELFGALNKNTLFQGVVFVAHDGKVLMKSAFGVANRKPFAPITTESKFRIGSVAKQFTAAAILKLQAQGKLNVTENVCEYLDPCPRTLSKVTLHQLLIHTSGVPDLYIEDIDKPHTTAELAARIGKLPLSFNPGAKYQYSNGGYLVLGAVIEQLSGMTYEGFLREAYFEPLEMRDTGVAIDDSLLAGYASHADVSNHVGAAGIYSTVGDLYRWAQALDKWERDPRSEYRAMFQPYVTEESPEYMYGYGLEMVQQYGYRYIGHPGGEGGYGAHVARFPDNGLTVIVLSTNHYVVDQNVMANIAFGEK